MKRLLIIACVPFLVSCSTLRPSARVFSAPGHGEGLYIRGHLQDTNNSAEMLSMTVTVKNGFRAPVFINAEERKMFPKGGLGLVCYDANSNVIATGKTIGNISFGGGHPENFVRIGPGTPPTDQLIFMCSTTTFFEYNRALDLSTVFMGSEIIDSFKEEVLPHCSRLDITIPMNIEYYLAGDKRRYFCSTNVTVTIDTAKTANQFLQRTR